MRTLSFIIAMLSLLIIYFVVSVNGTDMLISDRKMVDAIEWTAALDPQSDVAALVEKRYGFHEKHFRSTNHLIKEVADDFLLNCVWMLYCMKPS